MDSSPVTSSYCFPYEIRRLLWEFVCNLALMDVKARPLQASDVLPPEIVHGYLEEKMSIVADFVIKMGTDIECPILGCPVIFQTEMEMPSGEIAPVDKVIILQCCWKFVSHQSSSSLSPCPFCRSDEPVIFAGLRPKPLAVGSSIAVMASLLVGTAIAKSETRVGLIGERLTEMYESLQEVFMREFLDDLVVMKRDL